MKIKICLILITFMFVQVAQSQSRTEQTINDNWKFHKGGLAFAQRSFIKAYTTQVDELWDTISIPHTWNAEDPFDDSESYNRGISWYRKSIVLADDYNSKKVYIHFEGANQIVDVFMNGAFVGNHKGGYTAFTMDVTKFLKPGQENMLAVKVDNSYSTVVPPLSVGYGLYGGIYRDVWLIATNRVHFSMTNYGSKGVFISTPEVSKATATVLVKGTVINEADEVAEVKVKQTIYDAEGKQIAESITAKSLQAGEEFAFSADVMNVKKPALWSPETPVLYSVKSEVLINDKVVDELVNPLAFRWFDFDAKTGFSLNGEKYPLKGTNRHQDKMGLGGALSNADHLSDIQDIKDMGANFLRLAHYPQDPAVLHAADSIGLLLWEEIPVVNYINESKEFLHNSQEMLREMIRQHYNHPSIILWGSCNEIFLWNELGARASRITNDSYMEYTRSFVYTLDSTIRVEDPTRKSTLAMHGSPDYDKAGISGIPDVTSINLYDGWYSGVFSGFGRALDKRHKEHPEQVLFISEYGAGSDSRVNAVNPKRFEFSGSYQRMFHESYWQQIIDRPWLAGSAIWNQYDFSQPHTGGSIQHINQKGLQTWDRKKKDSYYLYNANWSNEPMVYIASREWTQRNGLLMNDGSYSSNQPATQIVDVYTNTDKVELIHNGKSLGIKKPNSVGKAAWEVEFKTGENNFVCKGSKGKAKVEDKLSINFKNHTTKLKAGEQLFVNMGYRAEFIDDEGAIWLPDQEYSKGTFGFVDGHDFMCNKDIIVRKANGSAVLYNYSLVGASEYKLDVPDGSYEVELIFAETKIFEKDARVFDVSVNETMVFENLDMYAEYGFVNAFSKTIKLNVENMQGINIQLKAIKGETNISAVRIKRVSLK